MLKTVCKSKVGDDYIAMPVEQKILELEVSMNNFFLMDVPDARYELGKEFGGVSFTQIAVGKDVVEEFTSGSIFNNDTDVFVSFDNIVQAYDVGVLEGLYERLISG